MNEKEVTATTYALFDKWAEELKEMQNANEKELDAQMEDFARTHNVEKNSPLTLMYMAFIGGIDKGLEIAEAIKEEGEENNEKNIGDI